MAAGICPLVAVQILCAGLCGFAPWCEATFFVQRRGDAKKGESFRVKGGRLLENSEGLRQMSGRLRLRRISTGTRFLGKAIPFVGKAANDVGNATNDVGNATNDVGNAMNDVGKATNDVGNAMNDVGNAMNDVGKATNDVGKAANDVGNATNDVGNATNDVGNAIQLFPASASPYSLSTNDLGFHAKTQYFR